MFGFIAKIPKIALIGVIVLFIGFSPEILATVNIDTIPPNVTYTYPNGEYLEPNIISMGTLTLELWSDDPSFKASETYCMVQPEGRVYEKVPMSSYTPPGDVPAKTSGEYHVDYETRHTFEFWAFDHAGNHTHIITYGEVGDAEGDFYMKDGNDPSYTLVSKDAYIRFNHSTIYFKFVSSTAKKGDEITRVWIDVVGQTSFDLNETVANTEWDGSSWTAPNDGTYTINGYFNAFGRDFRNLSILVGSGEEPTPPSAGWSTYDWLKVIGGALIAVGLIWRK